MIVDMLCVDFFLFSPKSLTLILWKVYRRKEIQLLYYQVYCSAVLSFIMTKWNETLNHIYDDILQGFFIGWFFKNPMHTWFFSSFFFICIVLIYSILGFSTCGIQPLEFYCFFISLGISIFLIIFWNFPPLRD